MIKKKDKEFSDIDMLYIMGFTDDEVAELLGIDLVYADGIKKRKHYKWVIKMTEKELESILKGINKITGCSKDEAEQVYKLVTNENAIL